MINAYRLQVALDIVRQLPAPASCLDHLLQFENMYNAKTAKDFRPTTRTLWELKVTFECKKCKVTKIIDFPANSLHPGTVVPASPARVAAAPAASPQKRPKICHD